MPRENGSKWSGFMNPKALLTLILTLILTLSNSFAGNQPAGDSDQQINDFSLSGYGDKGKKTWDIAGKSADIFNDIIKLKDITGNLYGNENIKLTADRGDFNKTKGNMHLEQDVVITTSSGAKLTTDSLDWDRKNDIVATKDKVNIVRDNMITQAQGAIGHPGLNKVNLEKDVKVEILPDKEKKNPESTGNEKIVITCDGPLAIDYEKNFATFNDNVKVDRQDSQIYSDKMDVYFSSNANEQDKSPTIMNSKIDKIVARGNVKIVKSENVSYSDEAIYSAWDKKITLLGSPKLIIYSAEEMNASSGN